MRYILLLATLMLLVLATACTTQPTEPPISSDVITTLQTATPTEQTTTIPTTTPVQMVISDEDINRHFLSIAFGRTDILLRKVYTGIDYKVPVNLNGLSNSDDIKFITEFARNYNQFTQTDTFHQPPRVTTGGLGIGNVVINFYPPDYLKSISDYSIISKKVDPETGDYLFVISQPKDRPTQYYINSDLSINERNHYIMKSIFHFLGFAGETYNYPDSYFYADNHDGIDLIPLDKAAISVMYNRNIFRGMSITQVKDTLLIDS